MFRIFKVVASFSNLSRMGCPISHSRPNRVGTGGAPSQSPLHISPASFITDGRPRVLITRPNFPEAAIDRIKQNCDVEVYHKEMAMPRKALLKKIRGVNGLLCCVTDDIDKEVLEAAGSELKVISTICNGYDHIDLQECKERGIPVGHTPGVASASVAEWTVTMMVCAGRNFVQATDAVKRGELPDSWDPAWSSGFGLYESVVGIVGMGGIGQMICQRVIPYGVKKILYHDISYPVIGGEQLGAEWVELDQLLRESDFVVSQVNLWGETREMFDKRAFEKMKATAIFINTSRAEVVNQEDLYDALKNGMIRGAGIDVTTPPRLPPDHPLLTLDNIIVTPHLASAETHVRIKMAVLAADNLLLGLQGEKMRAQVPVPKEVSHQWDSERMGRP